MPTGPKALARFLPRWQGVTPPRRGRDGLLDVLAQLQGAALPASVLEAHILRARVSHFDSGDLDSLCAAGKVVWQGIESLGDHDGRIALYLTDHVPALMRMLVPAAGELQQRICQLLRAQGALFFQDITGALGGFPNDVMTALWDLVWSGEVSSDTLAPLRSRLRARRTARHGFRSRRRHGPAGSEGRWSLLVRRGMMLPGRSARLAALATQLLERYGVLTREAVVAEGVNGGFAALYPALKALEETGRLRCGHFIAGLGAAQFALPGAADRLRQCGPPDNGNAEIVVMSACDPANAYGAVLPWPTRNARDLKPQRVPGARVILRDGDLLAFLGRRSQSLLSYLPEDSERRIVARRDLAQTLAGLVAAGEVLLIARIDDAPAVEAEVAPDLIAAGFRPTLRGLQHHGARELPDGVRLDATVKH
ncbi:MAG: Lhr family helicase [Chromatiales bacterium]